MAARESASPRQVPQPTSRTSPTRACPGVRRRRPARARGHSDASVGAIAAERFVERALTGTVPQRPHGRASERVRIGDRQVHTLSTERVRDVRRIADQGQTAIDVPLGMLLREAIDVGTATSLDRELAELSMPRCEPTAQLVVGRAEPATGFAGGDGEDDPIAAFGCRGGEKQGAAPKSHEARPPRSDPGGTRRVKHDDGVIVFPARDRDVGHAAHE